MYSNYIPNLDLFISMHVLKEATHSSKIEGTQTNIDEALLDKEDIPPEKRDDWEEVQNYIKAMEIAIDSLKSLPFSSRLIREAHKTLLKGERGQKKQPGKFRSNQNRIGGATINDAHFIPPIHTTVAGLMGDIEKFLHNDEIYFPELLKIALVHYQFETIHPFLDGNGRLGRLMIPLYLVSRNILREPILYLSGFFENNRDLYYENLMLLREKNNISQWFKFFLVGIIETAKSGIRTFNNILQLQKHKETIIQSFGSRSANAQKVINYLYQRPTINAKKVKKTTNLSMPSSYKLLELLESNKLIKEVTGGKRGRMYVFENYLRLFRE